MGLQYVGIAGAFILLSAASAMAQSPDWKLVWSDEFEGSKLDYSKWEAEVNAFGGGNQELQIFTDRKENLRVADGHLIRRKFSAQGRDGAR